MLYWINIFNFEIFLLEYVMKHSESIPTKNIWLCHFFIDLARKLLNPGKNCNAKQLSSLRVLFYNTFWNILNWFRAKKSDQKFMTLPFFIIVAKKWLCHNKKCVIEKDLILRFSIYINFWPEFFKKNQFFVFFAENKVFEGFSAKIFSNFFDLSFKASC